jgi:predicted DNA-binding transcriptional regulator AlpA
MTETHVRTPDAARHLGLTSSTLEKMRVRGDGPPFRRLSRRHVTYAVSALDAWARDREYRSTKEYAATG